VGTLTFKLEQNGLYSALAEPGSVVSIYWLLLYGPTPGSDTLDVADTWANYSGCYLFIPADKPIPDVNAFVANFETTLEPLPDDTTGRYISWLSDPTDLKNIITVTAKIEQEVSPPTAQVMTDAVLPLANVSLPLPSASTLGFMPDDSALYFQNKNIFLMRDGDASNLSPADGKVILPLSGTSAGALLFNASWSHKEFCAFFMDDADSWDDDNAPTGEIRYFYRAAQDAPVQLLRYPVFPTEISPDQELFLNVSLDPLNVWNSDRTRFGLDVSNSGFGVSNPLPIAQNFFSPDGNPLNFRPQQGSGYGFGKRQPAGSEDVSGTYAYLIPAGTFDLQAPTGDIQHLMCGLAGTEYLLLAPGATLEFVGEGNAHAGMDFPLPEGGAAKPVEPGNILVNDFTTAWVCINPATAQPGHIDQGYVVQPEASVCYSDVNSSGSQYPLALGSRVSSSNAPLPIAPYGGIWSTGADTLPDPYTLKAFESQIIGAARHTAAPKDKTNGPVFFDPLAHTSMNSGAAKTPEGLLVNLNDDGTIGKWMLALSPNADAPSEAKELSFSGNGNPVVSPDLSNALMNDKLFMVVTAPGPLGTFNNKIAVGEWTFNLDVGFSPNPSDPNTILIFKFTTALNLVDLVKNAGYWRDWGTFIGPEPKNLQSIQQKVQALLNTAKTGAETTGSPFADFWTKATDPNWTGILALNCGLDAKNLPMDLQDLLGGIDGELRAHHFGITTNRIKGDNSASWQIDHSSMFALIHYEKPYTPTTLNSNGFGFQVLNLDVQIENSALSHFNSRIAVTIPKLFNMDVSLTRTNQDQNTNGYNVIEVDGAYVKHGDSGTVVFDTKTPKVFKPKETTGFRVLNEVHVTDAALVPVSSSTQGNTITVTSKFALSGMLMFAEDASGKAAAGLDLFSYGDPSSPQGLGFASYNIAMETDIDITNNVGKLSSIEPDLTQFLVTSTSKSRDDSLLSALPLKLTAFLMKPDSSGWPVTFAGQSSNSFAADFALQFQMSLGSLGALSSVADSLDVNLVLGWGAANGDDDDPVWLLMVPPKTMLGQMGFGIEGVLDTTFSNIEVQAQTWSKGGADTVVYALYFKDIQIQLLGLPLVPQGSSFNFTLFADPSQGNASNMGWLMTGTPPSL